jgi:branched-chain amino acid transport system substrate-binding protein
LVCFRPDRGRVVRFPHQQAGHRRLHNRINAAGGVNGYKIKYILADTNSTPTGGLTAVQKLVQQDNVFAIVEDSSDFFGAEP